MIDINKATLKDAEDLSKLSITTFLTAHGHSAPEKDIKAYIKANFTSQNFTTALSNQNHNYYLCHKNNELIGYSNIEFNKACTDISEQNITYLSRIYFLKSFYGKGLAKELIDFNMGLCQKNQQSGIWLKVWIENKRAIQFYKKMGFIIVGESMFKISETHSNPNHHMYLSL